MTGNEFNPQFASTNKSCSKKHWQAGARANLIDDKQDIVVPVNDAAKPTVKSIRSVLPNIKVYESLKQ